MEGNSLTKEIYDIFSHKSDSYVSKSALIQQRAKIKPEAFEYIFNEYNSASEIFDINRYEGYRILAADGSDVNIALEPNADTYFPPNNRAIKGFNQVHLNALYDINNNVYVDVVIQPAPKEYEIEALRIMARRLRDPKKSIIIADRGYGSLDLLETIKDTGADYLVRVQNKFIKEISNLPLEECDIDISFTIVTDNTKETLKLIKEHKVKKLYGPSKFGKKNKQVTWFHTSPYIMHMRVVRFMLDSGEYETMVTSLDRNQFPLQKIKELYHMRWGIETSFRTLKYAIGLQNFHAKKIDSIKQEIFARLTVFNLCSRITKSIAINQKEENIYEYKINFTQAIHIIFYHLKHGEIEDIRKKIRRYLEPVRPGRKDVRKTTVKTAPTYFNYRIA